MRAKVVSYEVLNRLDAFVPSHSFQEGCRCWENCLSYRAVAVHSKYIQALDRSLIADTISTCSIDLSTFVQQTLDVIASATAYLYVLRCKRVKRAKLGL